MNNRNVQNVMEISHVGKVIENERQRHVILKDVSFVLEKGTITAVMGKSGSGKSTLLSIASGLDAPTTGTVRLLGRDYYHMSVREQEKFRNQNIGLLFQNYHLIPELTCEENIRMPICFSKRRTGEKRLDEWLRAVGLQEKRQLFPNQMSGGEQQRTAILRALVNGPELLFADEPTGALDSKTGNSMIEFLIAYAHRNEMTVLLVTHDMDIARKCDRVVEIVDGVIRQENS